MTLATRPTYAGFLQFVTNVMGVPSAAMPVGTILDTAYNIALKLTNTQLLVIPEIYTLAVYNLAGSLLVNFAVDPSGSPTWPGSNPPVTWWVGLRQSFHVSSFVAGVINSSSDQGTSQSLTVPPNLENLTIGDLQRLKDPYGRQYLAFAMDAGSLWGLS